MDGATGKDAKHITIMPMARREKSKLDAIIYLHGKQSHVIWLAVFSAFVRHMTY